ncbi:MAG: NGG1p interacting factor NIF3 [Candidatus Omnitrophota bacterium]
MRLIDFYNKAVSFGKSLDARKKVAAYEDSAILFGEPDTEVKKILIGIDMEVPEILLADKLRQSQGLDLVLSHHPEGRALAGLYGVMQLQVDLLAKVGIPRVAAQEMLDQRKSEVERRLLPNNHMRAVDAARLLNMPFMCIHTPADNHVADFLDELMKKNKPKNLSNVIDILMEIPEYKNAADNLAGPKIILGNPKRAVGEIFLEMTGGTEGPKEALDKLYKKGIRTLISMHLSEEHFKKVKDINLNVVIAGHISSDTLGLNLLLDRIEKEEKFSITGCSGFRRISRN